MIHIQLNIRNPHSSIFKNIKTWVFDLSKNKALEIEVLKTTDIINVLLSWSYRQSHAGLELEIGLLTYTFRIMYYDKRHWDYILNNWEKHEESNSKTDH